MRIEIYARENVEHQRYWAQAFQQGLQRHGTRAPIKRSKVDYSPCDLAVFWSYRPMHIKQGQAKIGADFLVMERGYLDRMNYTSLGFNGLHGEAEFHVENVPGDRCVNYRPWRQSEGEYWLIIGQVDGDAALRGLDVAEWASQVAQELDGVVYFRPHPKSRQESNLPILGGTLEQDMAGAKAVITYTSNTGVDAAVAGIPVVALHPGSIVYDVAAHNYNAYRPDRQRWAEQLGYCQWSADEIANGDAWAHLRQRYA